MKKLILASAIVMSSAPAMALPAGATSTSALTGTGTGNVAVTVTGTSVCKVTPPTTTFANYTIHKQDNGPWWLYSQNTSTTEGKIEAAGYSKVRLNGQYTVGATPFSGSISANDRYMDVIVKANGTTGTTHELTGLGDVNSSTGAIKEVTITNATVPFRIDAIAAKNASGFKTFGSGAIKLTITCIN